LFSLTDIQENSSVKRSFSKAARRDKGGFSRLRANTRLPAPGRLSSAYVGITARGPGGRAVEALVNQRVQKLDFYAGFKSLA